MPATFLPHSAAVRRTALPSLCIDFTCELALDANVTTSQSTLRGSARPRLSLHVKLWQRRFLRLPRWGIPAPSTALGQLGLSVSNGLPAALQTPIVTAPFFKMRACSTGNFPPSPALPCCVPCLQKKRLTL